MERGRTIKAERETEAEWRQGSDGSGEDRQALGSNDGDKETDK